MLLDAVTDVVNGKIKEDEQLSEVTIHLKAGEPGIEVSITANAERFDPNHPLAFLRDMLKDLKTKTEKATADKKPEEKTEPKPGCGKEPCYPMDDQKLYREILKRKVAHYGETRAAYEFAAMEFAKKQMKAPAAAPDKLQKQIDELKRILWTQQKQIAELHLNVDKCRSEIKDRSFNKPSKV